jgi:hypothetical protein
MPENCEQEVIILASKITATIAGHPDAHVAEAACAVALELARLRVKHLSLHWRKDSTLSSA